MTDATAAVSPLRRRMIDDLSLRNLSPATQRSCLHAVKRFSRYFGRSPDRLGLDDIRAFQVNRHPELVSGSIVPHAPAFGARWMLKQVQHDKYEDVGKSFATPVKSISNCSEVP